VVRTKAPRKPRRAAKPKPQRYDTVHDVPWSRAQQEAYDTFLRVYQLGVFVDTETTGLDTCDQICEIALVDITSGETLFYSKVKPSVPFHPDLTNPMGKFRVNPADYADAPSWAEVEPAMRAALGSKQLVCWAGRQPGMPFDRRMIDQSRQSVMMPPLDPGDLPMFNINLLHHELRREMYQQLPTQPGEGGLARALRLEGLEFQGQEHTALVDAIAGADLVRKVVKDMGTAVARDEALAKADDDRVRAMIASGAPSPKPELHYPEAPQEIEYEPGQRVRMLNHVTWRFGQLAELLRRKSGRLWSVVFEEDNVVRDFTEDDFEAVSHD
jgi:DNA polymerase III epsilon subunit-like protein